MVQILLAVAIGPPEARMLHGELGEFGRREFDGALSGREGQRFRECDLLKRGGERAANWSGV